MKRTITAISLPHSVCKIVGKIMDESGFHLDGTGGGCGDLTMEGVLTYEQKRDLVNKMADVLFEFEEVDLEDSEIALNKTECMRSGAHLADTDEEGFCLRCGYPD